jgi:hypothetical protein
LNFKALATVSENNCTAYLTLCLSFPLQFTCM